MQRLSQQDSARYTGPRGGSLAFDQPPLLKGRVLNSGTGTRSS